MSFEEFEKDGAANLAPEAPASASDVATICYTSGTTGLPVMCNLCLCDNPTQYLLYYT
jgi:long-subunit acyl-CoA synthetase (AMP-forming)